MQEPRMEQRAPSGAFLSASLAMAFSGPRMTVEENALFSFPRNSSRATRNEGWPGSPDVEQALGTELTMKKLLFSVGIAVIGSALFLHGCSKEDRDEAMNRLGKAGKALNGEVVDNTKEHAVPTIVAEQQKKERVRQNTQWTPENQKLHPKEYCLAQLEETEKMGKKLDVQQHKLLLAKSAYARKVSDAEMQEKQLSAFLDKAKAAYKDADAKNAFPMLLNGRSVTKEKAQESIIEANRKLKLVRESIPAARNSLANVGLRLRKITEEQRNIVLLREKLQTTLNDLQVKQVIDGENGIGDALRAIDDSMNALLETVNEPALLDIMVPDEKTQKQEEFDAIMKD